VLTSTKLPDTAFSTNRYTACPCIRHADGYYYVLYLERRSPRHYFETHVTCSNNLRNWEISAANTALRADGLSEGINASDPKLVQCDGKTRLYLTVGHQLTWMNMKRAVYPGSLDEFLQSWHKQPGVPDWEAAARPR